MASVIRGSDNFDSLVHQGIGVNQTWQDVTASRVVGTTYTNTTGKPIFVSISTSTSVASSNGIVLYIDGVIRLGDSNIGSNSGYASGVNGIIPNGSTYAIILAGETINAWSELR